MKWSKKYTFQVIMLVIALMGVISIPLYRYVQKNIDADTQRIQTESIVQYEPDANPDNPPPETRQNTRDWSWEKNRLDIIEAFMVLGLIVALVNLANASKKT